MKNTESQYWKKFAWLMAVTLLAAGMWALGPTSPAMAQSPITVDDWGAAQSLSLSAPGVVSSTVYSAAILGDERDLHVELLAGTAITVAATGGDLYYTADAGTQAAALVVWDGDDGDPAALDPIGLGGEDLTAGGLNAFVLPLSVDAATQLTLTVYTNAISVSVYTVAFKPGSSIFSFDHRMPFAAFDGDADFSAVGAIVLEIAIVDGAEFVFGALQATRLPADLEITKAVYPDPAVAGRSLVYTVTVTNIGLEAADNVVISDTLPTSATIHTVDQRDDSPGDFDLGDYGLYTEWRDVRPWPIVDDDWLQLSAPIAPTGVYTSRVFDAFNLVAWDWLAWTPRQPYGKPLPDNSVAETVYELGNADMTGNQALLHLEEISYTHYTTGSIIVPIGGIVTDTSGNNIPAAFPAVMIEERIPSLVPNGKFGNALHFAGDLRQTLAISDTSDPTRYALELWVYPETITDTALILRTDALTTEIAPGHYSHMLGIQDGKFVHYTNAGGGRTAVGTTDVQTNTWYHLVGTAQTGGELLLYVNGREEARVQHLGALWTGGDHYRLAAGYGPTTTMAYFSGILDEVALYNRTLSSAEVREHYQRGALDMGFQVRACDDAACAGEAFAGPGGDPAAYYTERNAGGAMPLVASLTVSDSRYIQYQVMLHTDDLAYTPQLRNVSLGPAHRVVTATQGSCGGDDHTFSCTVGTILPGQVVTISTGAWLDSAALGWITNTAWVTTTAVDEDPANNTVTISSSVEAEVNLIVEKYDEDYNGGTDPVSPGSVMTYTIFVRNAGPSVARSVTVTDEFTAGTFINTVAPPGWDPCQVSTHTFTCTAPLLNVEWDNWQQTYNWEQITVTAYAPITEGLVTNTVWITGIAPELDAADNITTQTTLVTPVANLDVDKVAHADIVDPGALLVYTVTVTNNGPYTATNVVLTDTLPTEALTPTIYPGSEWGCGWPAANVVTCTLLFDLPVGASASLTLTAIAPQTGYIGNSVHATAAQYDLDENDNWDSAYIFIRPVADLFITKTDTPDPVYANDPLTYTLTVTNTGPADAGVVTTTVRTGIGQAMRIHMRPGESRPYRTSVWFDNVPGVIETLTVTLRGLTHSYPGDLGVLLVGPQGQNVLLMGNVGGGTDVNNLDMVFNQENGIAISDPIVAGQVYRPTNNGLTEGFRIAGPYGSSLANFYGSDPNGRWELYIIDTVYSDEGILADGWRLELTTVTDDTLIVTDTLPSGLSVQAPVQAPPAWECAGSADLTCLGSYLGVGEKATFEFIVTAPITGGVITNTAGITATTTDLFSLNNTAVETTTVIPVADLAIVKAVEPAVVNRGYPLTYTLVVNNLGPSQVLTTVTLTDALPAVLTNVQVLPNGWTCDLAALPTLTCTLDSLAVTGAPSLTITANAPITLGEVANTAFIASPVDDADLLNNQSTVTFTVIELPIADLTADNDSPTFLGNETHLWAVAAPEDNVTYTWDFGNGVTDAGARVTYTYPMTGVFTAIVTATNPASVLTAATRVTITEMPLLYLSAAAYSVTEADGPATITATLQGPVAITVTVEYATGAGTAAPDADYVAASGVLTFAPGVTEAPFTITIHDDLLDEPDETIPLALSNPSAPALLGTPATATLTILDDDPTPTLSVDNVTVAEPDGVLTFTVSLSAASARNISVVYNTYDATAADGADYTGVSGSLPFAPGIVSQTVAVTILDDAIDEDDETFTLTLSAPVNATLANADGVGTIQDDDTAGVALTPRALVVAEGGVTDEYTVVLASEPTAPVNVVIAPDTQLTVTPASLTFTAANWDVSQTVVAAAVDDLLTEPTPHTGMLTNTTTGADPRYDGVFVITVTAVITDNDNTPPVAVADAYTTPEDTSLLVAAGDGVLANDTDAEADPLTAILGSAPLVGTLDFAADGGFIYTPTLDFSGVVTFTYTAHDGHDPSNVAVVTISVTPVNDPPVAVADAYTTPEDTPLPIAAPGVLANDSDPDSPVITATLDTDVQHGVLVLAADGGFIYTPTLNFFGADAFTYHVADETGVSAVVTVALTVVSVNDLPVAVADAYTTSENTPLPIAAPGVLANDTDAEAEPLTAILGNAPLVGTLDFAADGGFIYTPTLDFSGVVTFTYTAHDGHDPSNVAVVTITVTPVNDPPVAVADAYTTPEDTPLPIAAPGVLANDSDPDSPVITATLDTDVQHGVLVLAADGGFVYTPTLNFFGADAFTYHVADETGVSAVVTVALTVVSVNDLPVAVADAYTTTRDTVLPIAAPGVLANDADVDSPILTATLDADVQHGALALAADGGFVYTPTAGFVGADGFTYHATDGQADSAVVAVTLNVIPPSAYRIYLPVVTRNYVAAPDLVVERLIASTNQVVVVIRNQGDLPLEALETNEFWVDVYINPTTPPAGVNQTWRHCGSQGLVWGVTNSALPLDPGEVLTLTAAATGDPYPYYRPDQSVVTWTLPIGAQIWAQVDSANAETDYGAVEENHEISGAPYNNIRGPVTVSGAANYIQGAPLPQPESPTGDHLPQRP